MSARYLLLCLVGALVYVLIIALLWHSAGCSTANPC